MITDLKPYPAYKDSGVEWLGEVPEHWEVHRTKSLLSRNDSGVWGSDFDDDGVIVLRSTEQTVNGEWNISVPAKRRLTSSEYRACRLKEGDLLVTKSSGSALHIGKTSIVTRDVADLGCCFSNFMQRLRAKKNTIPRFLWYAFNGELGRKQLDYYSDTTTGLANLNGGIIGRVTLASPPITEQTTIVRFLDHADRRIRRYIRAKQKLIALLEEQKQAIIHQAVTGQIDVRTGQRYPAYKPSGVEWLKEVPKHWEIVRNGRLFVQRNEIGFPELPILEVSLKTGVRIRDFENSDRKQAMSDRSMYKRAAKGDIAYNMMRMWQGAVGLAPVDGLVSPAYVVAKPLAGTQPRYYGALFRTRRYMAEVDRFSRGIVKDRNRLYWEDFKQMPAPCPPTDEQVQIARAINHNTAVIDEGKHRIEGQITFLREYGTRLIADVVTGKLDVREVAAKLPEVDPLADESDMDDIPDTEAESDIDEFNSALEEAKA